MFLMSRSISLVRHFLSRKKKIGVTVGKHPLCGLLPEKAALRAFPARMNGIPTGDPEKGGVSSGFVPKVFASRGKEACQLLSLPFWEAVKPPLLVPVFRVRLLDELCDRKAVRFDFGEDRLLKDFRSMVM